MASPLLTFGVTPPRRAAPRVETLRFIRDVELRALLLFLPALLLLVMLATSAWWVVAAGVAMLGLFQHVVRLTLLIRRDPEA
jgi:hypothetical protein